MRYKLIRFELGQYHGPTNQEIESSSPFSAILPAQLGDEAKLYTGGGLDLDGEMLGA